jgi:hypothetical protein
MNLFSYDVLSFFNLQAAFHSRLHEETRTIKHDTVNYIILYYPLLLYCFIQNYYTKLYSYYYTSVTRRPVFECVVPSSRQIWNGTPYSPVFFNSAILFRSYMKIVRYTSIMYGRHMFAIRMFNTSS